MTMWVPPPLITLRQPARIHFGAGCAGTAMDELASGLAEQISSEQHHPPALTDAATRPLRPGGRSAARPARVFVVTSPSVRAHAESVVAPFRTAGATLDFFSAVPPEPTAAVFENLRQLVRAFAPDLVIGVGGGSVLDVAKLVAALHDRTEPVGDFYGVGRVPSRRTRLACVTTTAGTGSEVSPNAVLLDETAGAKKAVISPALVPDVAVVDPVLMLSLPPELTATTGIDALAHCLEAYTSRAAHPIADLHALEGVRLIGSALPRAVADGSDLGARSAVALGSLYGGLCLGPVNTAAVHALAYPLGGEFHLPHGLSIALLLPAVVRFNAPAAPARHAALARALGATEADDTAAAGQVGDLLERLLDACAVRRGLQAHGIPRDAIPRLVDAGLSVTRLLKNNPRAVTRADAIQIYEAAC